LDTETFQTITRILLRKNAYFLEEVVMKKTKLNLIIEALMLLCVAGIGGIGLLMKYVLVPGYQRWDIYGRNVDLFFWGLDRHEWGMIHLVIAFVFLALLVLHNVLHWGVIVGIYRKLVPSRLARCIVAVILICLTILLFIFPVFVKPEVQERGPGRGRSWRQHEMPLYTTQRR
jgi:hypothetical protein